MGTLVILWVAFCAICFSGESKTIFLLWRSLTYLFSFFFLLESVSQTNTLSSWTCTLFSCSFDIDSIMPSWDPVWYFIIPDLSSINSFLYPRTWFVWFSTQCFFDISQCRAFVMTVREKGRNLTQSKDISPYTHRLIQKATWQHKNATKTFQNDCRST